VTLTARQLSDLLTTHGLRPSRALGQNFVIDPNTVRRIVRLAETGPGDRVIEIGPGLGSLTVALAEAGAQVTAVEIDDRLIPVLNAVLGSLPVRVVQGDALRMNWADLLGPEAGWVLVANLPYNIATPVIATLLDEVPVVDRLVIMVQSEVAERLVARPGHREYGAVSVKVAYWAEANVVARVPPTVFVPRPKVESALVSIRRRPAPAVDPARVDPELLFRLVRAGFSKRRKMLRRALAGLASPQAFEAAEVRPDSRAENLDVYAWGRLAAAVAATAGPGSDLAAAAARPEAGAGVRTDAGDDFSARPEAGAVVDAVAGEAVDAVAGEAVDAVAGEAGVPVAGEAGVPVAGEAGVPVAGEGGVPVAGEGGVPVAGEGGVPVAGEGGVPENGEAADHESGEVGDPEAGAVAGGPQGAAGAQPAPGDDLSAHVEAGVVLDPDSATATRSDGDDPEGPEVDAAGRPEGDAAAPPASVGPEGRVAGGSSLRDPESKAGAGPTEDSSIELASPPTEGDQTPDPSLVHHKR
jgi:16S rRNA (adenine1518-N6/adenine1519-N6)-dimethyltransferase